MKIVLGSNNIPKKNAVITAFSSAYKNGEIDVECVATDSGVSSHPTSVTDSLQGAINRLNDARRQRPDADYHVGIEGGLLQSDGRAWEIGWVAIGNSDGKVATGLSAGIEMKGELLRAILDGTELSEVLDKIHGVGRIGDTNGFLGLATDDVVTRQQAYEQGIQLAIAQFKKPELFT